MLQRDHVRWDACIGKLYGAKSLLQLTQHTMYAFRKMSIYLLTFIDVP